MCLGNCVENAPHLSQSNSWMWSLEVRGWPPGCLPQRGSDGQVLEYFRVKHRRMIVFLVRAWRGDYSPWFTNLAGKVLGAEDAKKGPTGQTIRVVIRQETPMPTGKLARIAFCWGLAWPFGQGGGHIGDWWLDSAWEVEYLKNPQSNQPDFVESRKTKSWERCHL